jgi:hypothetical protein
MKSFLWLSFLTALSLFKIQISIQSQISVCTRATYQRRCMGQYGETCGSRHCAKSESSCSQFESMKEKSLLKVFLMPFLFHAEVNNYKTTMKNILPCPKESANENVSKVFKNVCRLNNKCYSIKSLTMANKIGQYIVNIECKCKQPFGYRCHNEKYKDLCGKYFKKFERTIEIKDFLNFTILKEGII